MLKDLTQKVDQAVFLHQMAGRGSNDISAICGQQTLNDVALRDSFNRVAIRLHLNSTALGGCHA